MNFGCKHAIAIISLLLSLAAPVAAGPFEDAAAAYGKGDYTTALRLLHPLADQGMAKAQIILGVMYANGQGVSQNQVEAMKWYRARCRSRGRLRTGCCWGQLRQGSGRDEGSRQSSGMASQGGRVKVTPTRKVILAACMREAMACRRTMRRP